MSLGTADAEVAALTKAIKVQARAAYRHGNYKKYWRYFIGERRNGRWYPYQRRVISFEEHSRLYAMTYCLDWYGNVYRGCDDLYRITATTIYSGFSRDDVDRLMEIDCAKMCDYRQVNLAEKCREELETILNLIKNLN